MARLPRFVIPDQPQHVILRGNNRAETFCADADYSFYLEKLKSACDKHECTVHAYVLMTNHVHLLVTPHLEQSLSKAMQMLGRYYVQLSVSNRPIFACHIALSHINIRLLLD
jgi:putative transposase